MRGARPTIHKSATRLQLAPRLAGPLPPPVTLDSRRPFSYTSQPVTRAAILQSNYIPWKGYFDMIAAVDRFILYDEVQYTHSDWRNRNRIKTPQGVQWLSIPVGASIHRRISDVMVTDTSAGSRHWSRLAGAYRPAPCFRETASWIEPLYTSSPWRNLSEINERFIHAVCGRLNITTQISRSVDHPSDGDRNGRLIALCRAVDADTYVSGPSARAYLDADAFERAGISVEWFDYAGYPEYRQLWGPFQHDVSIVDLMFNCGDAAAGYLKCGRS